MNCHLDHEVYELFEKRAFRCDCGNSQCNKKYTCSLHPKKDPFNPDNAYGQNFDGLYCYCSQEYNPDTDVMFQCLVCQDWFHDRCLISKNTDSDGEFMCAVCSGKPENQSLLWYLTPDSNSATCITDDDRKDNNPKQSSCNGSEPGSVDASNADPLDTDTGKGTGIVSSRHDTTTAINSDNSETAALVPSSESVKPESISALSTDDTTSVAVDSEASAPVLGSKRKIDEYESNTDTSVKARKVCRIRVTLILPTTWIDSVPISIYIQPNSTGGR